MPIQTCCTQMCVCMGDSKVRYIVLHMYVCGERQNWSLANAYSIVLHMSIMCLGMVCLMYVLLIFVSGMTHNMVV